MPRLPRLAHKALVRQANWKGLCLITGKQFFQNIAALDLSRITLQWAKIKKWGQGSGGQFHTNHCILSTRTSSWCLCLQECGKGLLVAILDSTESSSFLSSFSSVQLGTINPLLNPLSQIFPPSLISPPFQGKKVGKPPLPSPLLFFSSIWYTV